MSRLVQTAQQEELGSLIFAFAKDQQI